MEAQAFAMADMQAKFAALAAAQPATGGFEALAQSNAAETTQEQAAAPQRRAPASKAA
jgi:hypothetical protein